MRATADVVVVGGGIIGCATAAELAEAGASVVVLERAAIAAAASGRNHGLIFAPEDPALRPLASASMARYRELAERSAIAIGLDAQPVGLLVAVSHDEQWGPARREAAAAAGAGCAVELLDEAAARAAEPALAPGVLGGYLIGDGYRVDPAALTLALADRARSAGAEVVTHTEVKQVLAAAGRVRGVATDAGTIAAGTVVDAAGPWAAKLARSVGHTLPVGGVRGWLLLTAARPGLMRHLVVSAGWHLAGGTGGPRAETVGGHGAGAPVRRDVGTLVQQNPDHHILLGGSRAASLDADGSEESSATVAIARGAAALVPALAEVPLVAAWSGVRPTSPDGRPLLGWLPGIEGFFVAGGHGGQGVTLGAGSGRLAAETILGAPPHTDPAAFTPARFHR